MPFILSAITPRSDGTASLRVGVERGIIATLSIVALLLALLALPDFSHDHVSVVSPWVVLSLLFAAVLVIGAPLAIMRRRQPAYAGLDPG